jgi:YidC/Oxa1 family membrane protein insertase
MQLYRDENTSPLAGCLPVLIQAPVVGVLYTLFLHTTIAGHPNALLDETLLGVPLGSTLLASLSRGDTAGVLVCAAIVVIIALVGEITRRAFRVSPVAGDVALPAAAGGLIGALQFVTAVVAAFVPLAAGLYLVVTVTWTLGQRLVLRRIYPAPRT